MSLKAEDENSSKGSWAEAEQAYRKWWLGKVRVGFFTFDCDEQERTDDLPTDREAVVNARTSFRTIMTFLKRRRLQWNRVFSKHGEHVQYFFDATNQEDAHFGNQLLAQILYRFAMDDDEYFEELDRLRKAFRNSPAASLETMPAKFALYRCALDLQRELGEDPIREAVMERLRETTRHRPSDQSSLFRDAKLAFLAASLGRPKKSPG